MRGLIFRMFSSANAGTSSFLILGQKELRDKILQYAARYDSVTKLLENCSVPEEVTKLAKEQKRIGEVAGFIRRLEELEKSWKQLELVESSAKSEESEFLELAREEKAEVEKEIGEVERAVADNLIVETDKADEAVLEVRAGTGGTEAQLFASELMDMYERFSKSKGWRFRRTSYSEAEGGGCREACAVVEGNGCYDELRFEGGVHRVQRRPVTDRTRIHTSTTTVAVLPSAKDLEVSIPESELQIETMRARGAGGQHVNTTDSAIRITHLPTGIVVAIQDDRSQHRNKAQALKILQAKVYDLRKAELDKERAQTRRSMIGSGERSERIRTYNFPQDRVTDHRVQVTVTGMDNVMSGEALSDFTSALRDAYIRERLQEFLDEKT